MTEIQNSKQKNRSLKCLVTRSAGACAAFWNLWFGIYFKFGACNLLFAAYAFSKAPVYPD